MPPCCWRQNWTLKYRISGLSYDQCTSSNTSSEEVRYSQGSNTTKSMSAAVAAGRTDKRRPPMAFHGRTGYNIGQERQAGYCALDAGAGWGKKRSDASSTPCVWKPYIEDSPWSSVGFRRLTVVEGKLEEHERILDSIT